MRFTGLIVCVAMTGVCGYAGAQQPPTSSAPIRLKAFTFNPGRGEEPRIPQGLAIAGYVEGQRGYYIVQFRGPVLASWKDEVAAAGAELLEYVPDFAFKVRMNPAQSRKVVGLGSVAWVGLFHPAYKLSPKMRRDGTRLYVVRIERGADLAGAVAGVVRSGARVVGSEGNILTVVADSAQLDAIAHVIDVAWIENFLFRKRQNEYGAGVILGANTANASSFDGSTQKVAVADTGLGGGTTSTAHADIPASRITALNNWPGASNDCYNVINDGAKDVDSGHGTHVAVSVLGDGGASNEGRGTAPAASLFFQAVENWADMKGLCSFFYPDGYYLIGIPSDIRQLFQQAYDGGVRIHSNSWGSEANGDYTVDSANADNFVWNRRDMALLFAAGNSGTDANADGVIDNDSIISPATAKNVISVGASESDRQGHYECDSGLSYTTCTNQNGQNSIFTYGAAWGYPADPIASDPSAGNGHQMAAFSSRGPTDDGRIKPDVTAPGTWVLSGFSDLYQQGYDGSSNPQNGAFQYDGWGFPLNQYYKYMGGTSMSTPLTAGAVAVVRDYYQKAKVHSASAALVKATLINSAVDMLDENNDGANDNDFPIPNNHEGWGRVNVANATDGSHEFVDNTTGVATGGSANYTYSVPGDSAFKVTLVWSDYPSTESASKNLVNDLDLVVTSPSATIYRGNVFSGGWSGPGGSADRTNNVENVYIQSAGAGTWTVEVQGFNVPNGPQPFALVVDGGSTGAPPSNNPPSATFTYNCTNLTCNFDGSGSGDSDGTITNYSWNFGDGQTGSGATPSHSYAGAGTYTVTLTVTDDDGATDTDSQQVTVTAPSSGITLTATGYKVKGLQKADLAWSGATSTSVDLYRNSVLIATTANDGSHTDNIDRRGGGSYTYKVCEAGGSTACSNEATVTF